MQEIIDYIEAAVSQGENEENILLENDMNSKMDVVKFLKSSVRDMRNLKTVSRNNLSNIFDSEDLPEVIELTKNYIGSIGGNKQKKHKTKKSKTKKSKTKKSKTKKSKTKKSKTKKHI